MTNVDHFIKTNVLVAELQPYKPHGDIEIVTESASDLMVGTIEVAPQIRGPVEDGPMTTIHDFLLRYNNRELVEHPDLKVGQTILVKAYDGDDVFVAPMGSYSTLFAQGRYLVSVAGVIGVVENEPVA